jgi:hypothetical protein
MKAGRTPRSHGTINCAVNRRVDLPLYQSLTEIDRSFFQVAAPFEIQRVEMAIAIVTLDY